VVWGVAPADIVVTTENQTFPNVHVDSMVEGPGGATFYVRAIKENQVLGPSSPLAAAQVGRIEFRTPWDSAERPTGRPATAILQDGRRFEGVWVETFTNTGQEQSFQLRMAGTQPGGETHTVPASYLRSLALTPMNLPGADLPEVPGLAEAERAYVAPGVAPGQTAPAPSVPSPGTGPQGIPANVVPPGMEPPGGPAGAPSAGPAPAPVIPPPAPGPPAEGTPAAGPQPEMPPTGFAPPGAPGGPAVPTPLPQADVARAFSTDGDSGRSFASTTSEEDWNFELEPETSSGGGSRSSGWSSPRGIGFSIFGYFVGIFSLLIAMTVAFTAGGISLYFSARTEDTKDLGFPKALATAAMLTIIPLIVFFAVFRAFIWLADLITGVGIMFAFTGLILGLTAWWYTARAIVMGMLEVLESKASSILIWFLVYLVLGQYLAAKAIAWLA